MIVKDAKEIARQWVFGHASNLAGFHGAFYHGSINWLPDDAVLSASSDVDVMVVFAEPPAVKLGKFIYADVMLEISYLSIADLQSAEQILGQSHLAGSFNGATVIADPTGQLTRLQEAVTQDYAKRKWVTKRCEHARDKILGGLEQLQTVEHFHEQVMTWLFATGVTTHIPLVAGLRNPTVRKRYVAAQEVLADYGHLALHESLLELQGSADMSQTQVANHLTALTNVFDATTAVIKTPFFFASDLSKIARPIAIDGSRALIENGLHREAIFWIVATYARCQTVLHHDGTVEMVERYDQGFRHLLVDLGIHSFADMQQRGEDVKAMLPQIWAVGEAIMAANPEIDSTPR